MDVSAEWEAFFFPQGERQMAKKKWYVVWKGKKPGIYSTWAECEKQVKGFKGAKFKSFPSYEEAEAAFNNFAKIRQFGFLILILSLIITSFPVCRLNSWPVH